MLEIQDFQNAAAQSLDGAIIDVDILHPVHGWIPYTIDPEDTGTSICNEALIALIGNDYIEYSIENHRARLAEDARIRRSLLLKDIDAFVSNPLRWNELTKEKKSEWAEYRKSLLDITDQSGFPETISWPNKPE